MKRLLLLLCLLLAVAPASAADLNLTLMGVSGGGATYTGPGDIVSGATAWYGLRAYNAAYAATPGKSVNVRRASDNVACDVNVATSGGLGLTTATCNSSTQGGITPSAFAGTDATATCTLASTTATCASASSTPHVGSTVVGASLTQPCLITAVGTFTGGAGTFTTSLAGTSTSCGTISVGETFTMTYGLFVTEAYDQTGNGHHVTQATAANQPQLLPNGGTSTNSLPIFAAASAGSTSLAGSALSISAQPLSASGVASNTDSSTEDIIVGFSKSNTCILGWGFSNSSVRIYIQGTHTDGALASGTWAAINAVANGASPNSVINVNGTETTGSVGTGGTTSGTQFIDTNGVNVSAALKVAEGGVWPVGFSSGNRSALHANQSAYYGTP